MYFNLFAIFDKFMFPCVIDLEFVQANSKCYLKTSIILIPGEQSILAVPGTVKREASHVPVCALELYNCSGRHPLS